MADQSWRAKPPSMSPLIVEATARRIAEHAERHALRHVRVVMHGGEPLLLGARRLMDVATSLHTALDGLEIELQLAVQTNGALMVRDVLDVLLRYDVKVGISVDGDREAHDRHRRLPSGGGTYDMVAVAIDRLRSPRFASLFAGLICTVDITNDPVATYEALLAFSPPTVDFLLPHGNWVARPPHRDESITTPYADWLLAIFERWYTAPRRETSVRLFEDVMNLSLGGPSRSESVGLTPVSFVVVDTDGSIEQADTLKSSYPGAPATALNVLRDPFDAALDHPAVAARQIGLRALCDDCLRCSQRDVCGGGNYVHRYRAGSGFKHASVYCPDLFELTGHIGRRVRQDVQALFRR